MIIISQPVDIDHPCLVSLLLILIMVFSKSFGYALRSILYIAWAQKNKTNITLDELARDLAIPRHFLAKIMKTLVKRGILNSIKGPSGGFYLNESTMQTHLLKLAEITGEAKHFNICALRLQPCDLQHPCPLHTQAEALQKQWHSLLVHTTINNLLDKDNNEFIKSIRTVETELTSE